MNSSAYFFPGPGPDGGDAYGAAFVRDPSVIKGNELPAIQGAQAYGNRMLEGARAAQECAKSPDQKLAMTCKEFLTKFCDRAKSAFELSQDETKWWRRDFATFQSDAAEMKRVKGPPKLIQQTRLIACGIDEIRILRMFHEDDVDGTSQIAMLVGPENQNLTASTPAARDASAAAAQVPAPNAVAGAVATAPLVTKAANAKLDASTPAPKKKAANPSKAPPLVAPVRAAASPKPVPNAGPVASQKLRMEESQIAAISSDYEAVKSRTERREREATLTPAPKRSAMTGTFAGQLFGYSGGHIFSSDLVLTLVGAGKEVKGAWTSEQGKSGKVTGKWAESNIASLRLEQLEPCAGTYAGSAVILEDGQRLHGSYTGTDCKGPVDVSFIVVKH